MNTPARTGRSTATLLLVLFGAPLAAAFWLYYGTGWRPTGHTNHGELIDPARPLTAVALAPVGGGEPLAKPFHGKWSLVVLGQGSEADHGCNADCQGALVYARQTWLSLGKELTRAQRVLLAGAGCCDTQYLKAEHDGLVALDASGGAAAALLAQFPAGTGGPWVYVVDPLGNLMMRYDVHAAPKGLLTDLKKLLNLSSIG